MLRFIKWTPTFSPSTYRNNLRPGKPVVAERGRAAVRSPSRRRRGSLSRRRSFHRNPSISIPECSLHSAHLLIDHASVLPHVPVKDAAPSFSSSDHSIPWPPGFQNPVLEIPQASTSATTPPVGSRPINLALEVDSADADVSLPLVDIEEGEFTPVVSKKSKKMSKVPTKARGKRVNSKPAPGRALLLKGAMQRSSK
ncbi:hypothetical protein M0R45_001019 [Rubus argutus]|uniref:Uncharacterized protein n=1 Tax=Rubus argutus TaxID=59490 RepID=A0AAW1VP32_RUBAR